MARLKRGLARLPYAQLLAKSDFIVGRMTDNLAFPSPTPSLAAIIAATEELRTSIPEALDGGKTATAKKKARYRELQLLLNQLAGYVASVAEGNELAILSSGFEVRKYSSPRPELDKPTDLRAAITDHTGRVDLNWTALNDALTYQVQFAASEPSDEKSWSLVTVSSRASAKVTGLPSGQVAYFRVAGIGTKGMGPWSQVVSTLVR